MNRCIEIVGMSVVLMGMFLFVSSSYAKIDPATVVGAWLFDNDAKDSSGNGNDGEIVGKPASVDGQFGKALDFNGTSDWVHIPSIGTYDEFTVAAWVNSSGRVGMWRSIFCNDGWKAGDIHHQLYASNVIGFSLHSNPGGNDIQSAFMFGPDQTDEWRHIATVYNSGEAWIRFYVDGELDVERPWGGNPAVIGPARIASWDGGGREWQGMMDDFIFFSTALEEDDVQALMNEGFAGEQSVEPTGKLATNWGSVKTGY